MQSLKFIRTLSLARNNLLRAGRANGGSAKQLTKKVIIGTGATGTLLGLSFWGSSTPKEDENKFSALPSNDKGQKNLTLIIRETDALYDNYLIDNAYAILRKHANGDEPELLWRLARVVCEMGKQSKDPEVRKRLFIEAHGYCKKALENQHVSGCFGAEKWMAILLDYVGEIEGTKSRIKKSYQVKEHLERAVELNPFDATTYHILGVWHFTFADMPTYQKYLAAAIFATPPSSTYEEALRYFEKSDAISKNYSTNTYYIGECYSKLNMKDEARIYYLKAFKAPVITIDDKKAHENSLAKLKAIGMKTSELV